MAASLQSRAGQRRGWLLWAQAVVLLALPLPSHYHPTVHRQVVPDVLKGSTPIGAVLREFQHGLHHLLEEVVAPKASGFQIAIHAALLAGLP